MHLGKPANSSYINRVSYWYSMWSHKRDGKTWKGFLQLDLAPEQDVEAREYLDELKEVENGL